MTGQPRALTIAILAMGGEGGGVLADWIVDMAEHAGYCVQLTSVPGVAQRTGSTIYYIEMMAETAGREPVLALMPVPGEVDIVIASELMEAGRALQRGLVTPDRTTLITSTHRVYSMTEKTAAGDGRVDSAALLEGCKTAARQLIAGDFARLAAESGSVISAALFGGLAMSEALPFPRGAFEEAIRRGGVGVDSSLAAFEGGAGIQPAPLPAQEPPDILRLAIERLTEYQDAGYAAEFQRRLEPFSHDPILRDEVARHLALWMSYEDAIRVAGLKIRRERFERVRREVRAGPAEPVEIHEYLHPGVNEIADILPAALGRWLLSSRWAGGVVERLTGKGRIVHTTSISGFLQLYLLAGMRPWRRRSLRFQREQVRIEAWLAAVRANPGRALELAALPALLKGYGETYERGRREFEAAL